MALKAQPLVSPIAILITAVGTICFNALAFAFYSIVSPVFKGNGRGIALNAVIGRLRSGLCSAQVSGGLGDVHAACCIRSIRLCGRSI